MELSFKENNLKFYFVINDKIESVQDVSGDMGEAHANLSDYLPEGENINWIQKSDCLKISRDELSKKDIFVMDDFSGAAFEYLQKSKSLILGPRCLVSCLLENASIPLGKYPVFNTAMRDLVVCASGFSVPEKAKLKNLVFWMGGYYLEDLSLNCTHLVSNTVMSNKYEKAAFNCIPIMHADWVYSVWGRNKTETVSATSSEFEKHQLPIFYKLNFTSTGIVDARKTQLEKLINEHGGRYMRNFRSSTLDILLVEKNNTESDKFRAAISYKKECLLPDWVFDSVAKKYALPILNYRVVRMKASTPTKNGRSLTVTDFNPDGTHLSEISCLSSMGSNCSIAETICGGVNDSRRTKKTQNKKSSQENSYKTVLEKINPVQAKKARLFLDGCSIYLSGFSADEKEKLKKVLNSGAATHFDEISDKLTHVIIGELIPSELVKVKEKAISASIVSLKWLVESIAQKQPANEEDFIFRAKLPISVEPEAPSPSSKKTLQSMNHSFKKPMTVTRKHLNFEPEEPSTSASTSINVEADLVNQYVSKKPPSSTIQKQQGTEEKVPEPSGGIQEDSEMISGDFRNLEVFVGLTFYVHEHYDEIMYTQIVKDCENGGGNVVNAKCSKIVDYIIVPSEESTDLDRLPVKGKHIVNNLWIEDVVNANKLIEGKYYHQPIPVIPDERPLEGITIVISTYSGTERHFIEQLAAILGAQKNDVYARKEEPILICPLPEGAKFKAAQKWGFPVVTVQWLIDCAYKGSKLSMDPYLINDPLSSSTSVNKSSSSCSGSDKSMKSRSTENNPPIKEKMPADIAAVKHPRVSELCELPKRPSIGSPGSSPNISINLPEEKSFNISDYVKTVSSPLRDTLYNILKEEESKPDKDSEHWKKLIATPGNEKTPPTPKVPESCTLSAHRRRNMEYLDRYYIPIDREKCRRQSTPLAEHKRRLWKELLGEEYVEDQFSYYNTPQTQVNADEVSDKAIPGPSTSTADQNTTPNYKRLSDFIKNRDDMKNKAPSHDEERETTPPRFDNDIPATAEEMVGWEDPSEYVPSKRQKANGKRFSGIPRFSISCSTDKKRDQIASQIKTLGGEVCQNLISFDETCTHIVCEKPNRGEKILSGIASGKWILSLQYITDSVNTGFFLDEENYEFGNPKAECLPSLEITEKSIANAGFRWRTKVANDPTKKSGVFTGFKVILHVQKKDQFQRVITAGGGTVVNVMPPYAKSEEALQATHCLVEQKKMALEPSDHKVLAQSGIRVLSVMYLNAYLTNEVEPDYSKYILSV